jgi:hypothetical protein
MAQTYQSIVINAPVEDVWSHVRNFHDMSWAPNVIEKVDAVGDRKGDEAGAKRILNDAFHETLIELDDVNHTVTYSIDDGPSPVSSDDVSDYRGKVVVRPITESNEGTFVEWSSTWKGKGAEAEDFCTGIYTALLGELKKTLEG